MDASNLLWSGAAVVVTALSAAVGALWRSNRQDRGAHLGDVERLLQARIDAKNERIGELEKQLTEVTRKYERTCTKLAAAIERLSEVVDDGR